MVSSRTPDLPAVVVEVFDAAVFRVALGANLGDALGSRDMAEPGDVYRLEPHAAPRRLALVQTVAGSRVGAATQVGRPGAALRLVAQHHMIAEDGERLVVLAIEVEGNGTVVLPLSPLSAREGYTLLDSRPAQGAVPLPDMVGAAFAAGTAIVTANGTPRPIERLAPGTSVLTRDHGPQQVRALLRARLRASGGFAPVVFAPGVLGNAGELAVSPHQRIFLYRPEAENLGAEDPRLVQAKTLVNGTTVQHRDGGYVEYFSLVFDRHEIVYAEGLPCESLLVTEAMIDRLPLTMVEDLRTQAAVPPSYRWH